MEVNLEHFFLLSTVEYENYIISSQSSEQTFLVSEPGSNSTVNSGWLVCFL